MNRVRWTRDGIVHFVGANEHTLCGISSGHDMLGQTVPLSDRTTPTTEPVTCRACATLYCRVRNTPFHHVDDTALDDGLYGATTHHFCGNCVTSCPSRGSDAIVDACDRYVHGRPDAIPPNIHPFTTAGS